MFHKLFRWAILYALLLMVFSVYVLLDTFVIPRVGTLAITVASAETTGIQTDTETTVDLSCDSGTASTPIVTDTTYEEESIKISIDTLYVYDTAVYVADIQISNVAYLQTALANCVYGRNIKETTSDMAEDSNAIFAINGDYYGFRNTGYVIRNGVLYRDVSGNNEDLVIDSEGNFSIIQESDTTAQSLLDAGAWQVLSFGPALVVDGEIAVTSSSEVGQSMTSNPRTAIGQVSVLHYIVIVSDGRTNASEGLSLLELATLFEQYGCTVAYNLDGGGSATMWFNGQIVNNPTDGRSFGERKVSDIVFF